MKIISVMAVEGEVGVTTRAIELAAKAADEGQRVLAVDTTQTKQTATLLQHKGFHFLDDVRQLFKPLEQARWQLERMPMMGLLCLPEAKSWYRSSLRDAEGAMVFCEDIVGEGDPAAHENLKASLANLAPHFDLMILDVVNKYQTLMAHLYMVSDDVHFMHRADDGIGPVAPNLEQFLECQRSKPRVTRLDHRWTPLQHQVQNMRHVSL